MILGIQIIAIIFALIMIYFAYLHYNRNEINAAEIMIWYVIWGATIVIVIFPQLMEQFARTFAISRVFDLMVIGGFVLVISLVYVAYVRTKRLDRKIEEYTRNEALSQLKKLKTGVNDRIRNKKSKGKKVR